MIKTSLFFALCLLAFVGCTNKKSEQKSTESTLFKADYQELPDPSSVDSQAWKTLDKDLYAAFGSIDIRYDKNTVPMVNTSNELETNAWKGENVNTQLVLWSPKGVDDVQINITELSTENGAAIPVEAIETGFVRYVMTDEFAEGCGYRKPADFDSSLVADVIDKIQVMDIDAATVRPVWIKIRVPADTKPGQYRGVITVENASGAKVDPLRLVINVGERTLPPASEWGYHLDLWQNPFSVSRVHNVKNWSDEHMKLMKPSMKMLADAGQKVITASIIHDPWNSQTYDIYQSMVKWTKTKDGTWEFDYTIFDKWVNYMMDLGVKKQINCYSMIPWNMKFYYFDETLGKDTSIVAETGTEAYEKHWKPMLVDFAKHLKEKGWFDIAHIAMDERPMEAMKNAISLIKSVDEDYKIALAGNYHAEIAPMIDDYCVASRQTIPATTMQKRRTENMVSTYYTCCAEAYPNTFSFSPPAESAWLSWHAAAKGYDGYLRWAYNCWVENPLRDTRFKTWPAGDTYFVYPGARSSIRFEQMIDGIEAYEKISLLKKEFAANGDDKALQQLNELLKPFQDIESIGSTPAQEMLETARVELNKM